MIDDDQVSLQIRIPKALKHALAVEAASDGSTIRTLVLRALDASGYKVDHSEIRDKRKGVVL